MLLIQNVSSHGGKFVKCSNSFMEMLFFGGVGVVEKCCMVLQVQNRVLINFSRDTKVMYM